MIHWQSDSWDRVIFDTQRDSLNHLITSGLQLNIDLGIIRLWEH